MKILKTILNGVKVLEADFHPDDRGSFTKIFTKSFFIENNMEHDFVEQYYSINKINVIRGMHFQTPPFDHAKLVYVSKGKILDVVVDLRKSSCNYGKFHAEELSQYNNHFIYIPKGFAHGFLSLENNSIVNYAQTSEYAPSHDAGIRYDSFGFNWEILNPILSMRDKNHPLLKDFITPF